MELQPGATFAGYRIEALVGRGGGGFVYRARDLRLNRRVALKVLASDNGTDDEFRLRFERESRLAASIDHPNVIPIYEAGEADGLLYIAMRFVQGSDLKGIIRPAGRLDAKRSLRLLSQVASALDAAHAYALIHRDVKPGNVLVYRMASTGSDEHCYLCDFGLSRSARRPTITRSGEAVGTLDYMAPEQIRGEGIDGRVDVYALGCVLFECLTGQVPFPRTSDVAVLYAHLHEEPPRVTSVVEGLPVGLDLVIARGMAKDRSTRFATCGELIEAAQTALSRAPTEVSMLGEERRLVTVLHVSLSVAGAAQRLDPETFRDARDAFIETLAVEVQSEGGSLLSSSGDDLTAVFGAPLAHGDDPRRALRAALRLNRAAEVFNEEQGARFGIVFTTRTGVAMGETLVTRSPAGALMVTGEVSGDAGRLGEAAAHHRILVSERVMRSAPGFVLVPTEFKDPWDTNLSITAFELHEEEVRAKTGWRRSQVQLVGREHELLLLKTLFDRVSAGGRPHFATVSGDPGLGKSRLLNELLDEIPGSAHPGIAARGRCLPPGEGTTFWALGEVLRHLASVSDTDAPEVARTKIERLYEDMDSATSPSQVAHAVDCLCFSIGMASNDLTQDVDPRHIQQELRTAWLDLVAALAGRAPTVMAVEDIHWADGELLDLLDDLVIRTQGPLLMLCTYRHDLMASRPGWGSPHEDSTHLRLEPLSSAEADRLLSLLVGAELPSSIRNQILERADGSPFFLEEIVSQLGDEGLIATSDYGPRLTVELTEAPIPDTIQGVLAARMDVLDSMEREVLQSAAVIGRSFWASALPSLLDVESEIIDATLSRLASRGFIVRRRTSSMAGLPEYAFRHVLVRDVAYEAVPRRRRASAHAAVAAWLEGQGGGRRDDIVELLAHHYLQAHRELAPDPRAEPERVSSLRAAAYANSVLASESLQRKLLLRGAERWGHAALSVAAGPRELSRAHEALGLAFFLDSRGDEAWRSLKAAADLRIASDEAEGDADVVRTCIEALEVATRSRGTMRSRLSQAEAQSYLDAAFARVGGDAVSHAKLLALESFWPYSFRDEPSDQQRAEALRAGEEAAAAARALGLPGVESAALDGVGTAYALGGEYGRMDRLVGRRLELARGLDDPWEVGDAFAVASWTAFHVGRYREAFDLADEGFTRTRDGTVTNALHCLDWRALARCRLGSWTEFFSDVSQLQDLLQDRSQQPPMFASKHVAAAAFIHEVQGNSAAADRFLRVTEWLERVEERPYPVWFPWVALVQARRGLVDQAFATLARTGVVWHELATGLLLEGRCDLVAEAELWAEVPATLEEARTHADGAGLVALPLYADRLEGRSVLKNGDPTRAVRLLTRAATGFDAEGATWEAACTQLDLAEALGDLRQREEARTLLAGAKEVLDRLGSVREAARARVLEAGLA